MNIFDATVGVEVPNLRPSKLTDEQLAAAVLHGHLRRSTPKPLRTRLGSAALADLDREAGLVRRYFVA